MSDYEPRFDIDLARGRRGEKLIDTFLEWVGLRKVEVKTQFYYNQYLYVETEHDPGKTGTFVPSGLSVSTSKMWAFVVGETRMHFALPADVLRVAIADRRVSRPTTCPRGSCPTRGFLVDLVPLIKYGLALEASAVELPPPPAPGQLTQQDIPW